jgi:hypothetical protein
MIVRYALRSPLVSSSLERFNMTADASGHVSIMMLSEDIENPLKDIVCAMNSGYVSGWVAVLHNDGTKDALYLRPTTAPTEMVTGAEVLIGGIQAAIGRNVVKSINALDFDRNKE